MDSEPTEQNGERLAGLPCSANPVINGMRAWFEGVQADSVRSRNAGQQAWDSAILAASEYVRRRTNYNDDFALEIHGLLSTKLPKSDSPNAGSELPAPAKRL